MRLYQQERAILEVTELICQLMDEQEVSRSELARCLGTSKGYVTQFLDGRTNMTIRTISDVFTALNRALHFQEGSLRVTVSQAPILAFTTGWYNGELVGNADSDALSPWKELDLQPSSMSRLAS
jgi:transcriptional regulator with XRE-family HTH domain